MGLPLVLLAGFLVLFGALTFEPPVPGSGTVLAAVSTAVLWPLPSVVVLVALRNLRRRLCDGRAAGMNPRAWLRISTFATPAVVYVIATFGGWVDLTWQWAQDSHLLTFVLLATPLVVIELPRLMLATVAQVWMDGDSGHHASGRALPGFEDLWPALRLRLGWPLLLAMPCLVLAGGLDLLQLHREWHEFLSGTTLGATIGMLLLLAGFGVLLPYWFRVAFGVVRQLPEPAGTLLRRTAISLGFAPSRLFLLPTGGRAMNAMMVGPLSFGRILCITDGLFQALEVEPLTGVVAHEVGHARMGHPGLLMALTGIVPLLLMGPASAFDLSGIDPLWQAIVAMIGVVVTWSIVRALAHRFEHEADIASVRALGAGPCSRALMAVTGAALPIPHSWLGRFASMHPEERLRCDLMLRYEREPEFRQRFDATGRRLRLSIMGGLLLAAIAAAFTWSVDWQFERTIWRLNIGDVAGASRLDREIGESIPVRWRKTWKSLREDLAAAHEVAPTARCWEEAEPAFAATGWQRGVQVLLAKGPAAARPWFAIAASVATEQHERILTNLLYDYCRAADQGKTDRMAEDRAVARRVGVPEQLAPVFRDQ